MPLIPYTFEPGEIASSAEVNANFASIADAIGQLSTATEFRPPGRIILGPRGNYAIDARTDAAVGAESYLQLGYNTDAFLEGGTWKLRRFTTNEPATALRVGNAGFAIYTTSRTNGDLTKQFTKVFGITATTTDDRVYVRPHFTRNDAVPNALDDYRLTYVPLSTPQAIYNEVGVRANAYTWTAASFSGVASNARVVRLSGYATAGSTDGSIKILQARSARHLKYGFGTWVKANETRGIYGDVPLGYGGDYDGKFVVEVASNFTKVGLWIVGFYI